MAPRILIPLLTLLVAMAPALAQSAHPQANGFQRTHQQAATTRRAQLRARLANRASHPPPVVDTTPPQTLPEVDIQVDRDIAYGSDPLQRLDLYRPAGATHAPILFMVHGGGWHRGDKAASGVVDNKVAHWVPQGYALVSVNYRLVPQVSPLEEAVDVAHALAYVQANAPAWGLDANRVVLMGHSAGAHLVSLINANPAYAQAAGARLWVGTVALDSAAFNVVDIMTHPHPSLYDDAFGTNPTLWRAASPSLVLAKATAPMLLVCSSQRAQSCAQAKAFADKDASFHGYAQLSPENLAHGEINAYLGSPGELTISVDAFLEGLGLP